MHVRNVTAQLLSLHNPFREDILAEHYVDDWTDLLPPPQHDLAKRAERINTEIVHLSCVRTNVSERNKQWER